MNVGAKVVIERDETRYPCKGSWPRFRGREGTVVQINDDEHGVSFNKDLSRPDAWFKAHEINVVAAA
jgi:hypothetical protein